MGNRLIAAAALLAEDDVEGALEQARYARRKASRVAVVREVTGVAAYGAEEWQLAVNELRAAQRLGGTHDHVALIADCERALGHPERAIDIYREYGSDESVDPEVRVELLIVASGARRDMGMGEAATAMLKVGALNSPKSEPWVARLRYAYAEGLLADGLEDEAREWLSKAVAADEAGETGAAERLLELEGIAIEEFDEDDDFEDDEEDDEDSDEDFDDEDDDYADEDDREDDDDDDEDLDDEDDFEDDDEFEENDDSDEDDFDDDEDDLDTDDEEDDESEAPVNDDERDATAAAKTAPVNDVSSSKDEANPDAEESDDPTERRP
ncbi:Replicase polyprotein 1ab [Glycomyces sp. NPDC046736]|uniref:Replicase polyprotein 1ab n=1 Tax=Glycomyces sp. NPDC046736 TaxID=3155615 RepID=UPI0033D56D2B